MICRMYWDGHRGEGREDTHMYRVGKPELALILYIPVKISCVVLF